ncbi:uncharacterized protein LOC101846212 [Aplysia californica]|uniref:Uncharacterized protein LOC101846212 n=1 Tax=Aplysia californica TaxID=6500 RepID=A0ABM1A006_APLCA|nr:uncharacterized protein LOC101846212 [Aplysia californica]XP_012938048.1 uncharacterized protein LOC101846212 [Aplysia californica]
MTIWFQNRRRKDVVTKGSNHKPDVKDSNSSTTISSGSAADATGSENTDPVDDKSATDICGRVDDGVRESTTTDKPPSLSGNNASEYGGPSSLVSNDSVGSSSQTDQWGSITTGAAQTAADDPTLSQSSMVSPVVLRSMIAELNKFDNEYLKQKKSKKKSRSKPSRHSSVVPSKALSNVSSLCKNQKLFQRYDMVAPPNKVTPTAFLNTSANRFKHAGGTSAFQNPRENRTLHTGSSLSINDAFSGYPGLPAPSSMEGTDLLQQRPSLDLASAHLISSSLSLPSPTNPQGSLANFFHSAAVSAAPHSLTTQPPIYENLPVLSDLLGSYKNHSSNVAAAVAHRQLEHSLLSSPQGPLPPSGLTTNLFGLSLASNGPGSVAGGSSSSSISGDSAKSPASDIPFSPPPSQHPLSIHPNQTNPFNLNRVFPFPLIAEPPAMLSSLRQSELFRPHPQWPPPTSPLRTQTSGSSVYGLAASGSVSVDDDPYRPLLISSLSNPYFSPSSASYSLPSSSAFTSQPLNWPSPLSSDPTAHNYTQL